MPQPEFFNDVYEGDYWTNYSVSVGEPHIRDRIDEFLEVSAERVMRLQRFKSSGCLLDIGCSMGFLVKAAEDAGFQARGIDLSPETLEEGRRKFKVDIRDTRISDLPLNELYDAITCYNTIEHIVESQEFLNEMSARLAPDGVLALGTHDVESESHRREKRMWKHIMPTEHLYYFRRDDLFAMGARSNLDAFHADKPIDNSIVVYYRKS